MPPFAVSGWRDCPGGFSGYDSEADFDGGVVAYSLGVSRRLFFLIGILCLACFCTANAQSNRVVVLEVNHAISPATDDFIVKNLQFAVEENAELLIIRLDTPGGLDKSMRSIIKAILAADIPVATWVAPAGSRAASAGTFILYASHIAAMAPATNLGAATPVPMGGGPNKNPAEADGGKSPDGAMKAKATKDAAAYIRSLAELRGRNADWAELAVTEAATLSASEALAQNVVNFVARDLDDLLDQLNGYEVRLGEETRMLMLSDPEVVRVKPDARYEFMAFITDPSIAYILLMVGIWGLILEFYNPGTLLPGVVGVICLALGLFGLQTLPISYAGLLLIVLGIALMVAEAMVPSFGALGVGGVVATGVGSVILIDTDLPAYQISLTLVAAILLVSALLVIGLGIFALSAQRRKVVSGVEGMIGGSAYVVSDFDRHRRGKVRAFGELWDAEFDGSSDRLPKEGDRLQVMDASSLLLKVADADTTPTDHQPLTRS